ncbi:MAG: TRAP-type C4-dicarboxylate transport system, large permease component [Rhodobacteraceae bacterium HLUCCA12]|nr:MAG: TRAP-type C4-dicarboxylate transport system, large permease component [Rhodobacteraceae bacterium HLUCCA12]
MAWGLAAFAAIALGLGAALAYVFGAAATGAFVVMGQERYLAALPQRLISQVDSFTFLAMPLFILAAEMMTRSGVTRALIDLAGHIFRNTRGGLGNVNVGTSVFFAGISGSAVADAAALSTTLVPAMEERGYTRRYAAAITAASAMIGPIIPPSIILIIYGAFMNVSVAALFAGGILPGLLLGAALIAANVFFAWRDGHPRGVPEDAPAGRQVILRALPALILPVVIVSGIVFGVATPTESAVIAVLAAAGLSALYLNQDEGLTGRMLWRRVQAIVFSALERTAILTGAIFAILFASSAAGYLLAIEGAPAAITGVVAAMELSATGYLVALLVLLLVMGMIIDVTMALVLFVPLVAPAAVALGADPLHLGILICFTLTLGLITPPFGACLMIVATVARVPYATLAVAVMPFIAVEVVVLGVLTAFPDIVLALPRALDLWD